MFARSVWLCPARSRCPTGRRSRGSSNWVWPLNCRINPGSVFHRKNYYYADLPKNYQISQFDVPVCVDGAGWTWSPIKAGSGWGSSGVHMEEDTGKSVHVGEGGRIHSAAETLVDFNRAGTPLVEIVSRPDLQSAARRANLCPRSCGPSWSRPGSPMPGWRGARSGSTRMSRSARRGSPQLGVKVEIKNMNSFRSLEKAIRSEIERQTALVAAGERVVMETRHWDEEAEVTHGMRTKEGSSDYRYFTEPDLSPMVFDSSWVGEARSRLPELPAVRRDRYRGMGVSHSAARVLASSDSELRDLFEEAVASGADPVAAGNWGNGVRSPPPSAAGMPLWRTFHSGANRYAALTRMVSEGRVSSGAAREVLEGVMDGEGSPSDVAAARNLFQLSDRTALEEAVEEVMAANPEAVERYRSGERKVRGFLVGQVMRSTSGRADPRAVNEILSARL